MKSSPLNDDSFRKPGVASAGLLLSLSLGLSACGGGGGGGAEPPPPTLKPEMKLTLLSKPDDEVPSGENISYSFTLENKGPGEARSVDLSLQTDTTRVSLELSCGSSTGTPAPVCSGVPGPLLTIKNFAAGSSVNVTLKGSVKPGASGQATVAVAAQAEGDTGSSDKRVEHKFQTYAADLVLVGQGPTERVPAGGSFAYVLDLSNAGPDASRKVRLESVLVAAADRTPVLGTKTCVASGGAACPADLQSSALTDLQLPSGGRLVFTLPYQFAPGVNSGLVFSATATTKGDPILLNNTYGSIAR
jgi:hypothetical protein